MATLGSFGRLAGVQLRQVIRAVDEHTCLVICEVAKFNNFCPTLTLPHELLIFPLQLQVAGLRYYILVWSPGRTTFKNQDASKIGSEGHISIPN